MRSQARLAYFYFASSAKHNQAGRQASPHPPYTVPICMTLSRRTTYFYRLKCKLINLQPRAVHLAAHRAILPITWSHNMTALALKHHALLDVLMANPALSLARAARQIGMGETMAKRIAEMPDFQKEYETRRGRFEVFAMKSRQAKIGHLADTALERMQDHMDAVDDEGNDIATFTECKIAADIALKAAGMIGGQRTTVNIDNSQTANIQNNVQVDPVTLQRARDRLLSSKPSVPALEGSVVRPPVAPPV